MSIAYVALGSNLGDRRALLESAVAALGAMPGIQVRRMSALRETDPVGGPSQPCYLNGAAEIETALSPRELLDALFRIEREHGREREIRWGPRTLDLDLLLYGDDVVNEEGLTVPHPRLAERAFVLEPLCELAPGLRHPVLGRTMTELLTLLLEGVR